MCVVLPVNVAAGNSRGPARLAAQVNSAVSVDRTRMVNITFSNDFYV